MTIWLSWRGGGYNRRGRPGGKLARQVAVGAGAILDDKGLAERRSSSGATILAIVSLARRRIGYEKPDRPDRILSQAQREVVARMAEAIPGSFTLRF